MKWSFIIVVLLIILAFVNPERSIVYGSAVQQPRGSDVSDLAQQFNLTESMEQEVSISDIGRALNLSNEELEDLAQDISPVEDISPVACTVYPDFEIQLCLPDRWVLTKELYGNMNLSDGNSQNSTLTLEVVPCQEYSYFENVVEEDAAIVKPRTGSECESLRGEDLIRLYSPPELNRFVPPGSYNIMMLQYNTSSLRNESGLRGIDMLTDYSKKIISEIATDNRTIINQVAPTEIDGKKAVRISYDAPFKIGKDLVCCEHFTRIIVLGNNHIYEISYSLENSGQFIHIPEIEKIIENTKLTGPFTPGETVPGDNMNTFTAR